MTILMTTDTVGGVWTYALDLGAALERRGARVVLATMGPLPTHEQRRDAAAAGVELQESDFRLEWMSDAWSEVAEAGAWLLELERRFEPDVVHLNGYAHGVLDWQAPVVVVAHSCVCSWWEAVRGEPAPVEWDDYRKAVRAGLLAADAVVAPTTAMLDALRRCHGPIDHARVIANGRERAGFRCGSKQRLIFTAGRMWDEAKNLRAIAAAAKQVQWPVYVAGSGDPAASPGNADGNLRCLGSLPPTRIAEWMSRASIYALPARYEPFGLSAVEAGLSGCALVLADLPSLREVWGEAAWYVDADDPREVAAAINALIEQPDLCRRFARRARRRARRYTVDLMADRYLQLYQSLPRKNGWIEGAYSCES